MNFEKTHFCNLLYGTKLVIIIQCIILTLLTMRRDLQMLRELSILSVVR